MELNGEVRINYEPYGVVCTIDAPVEVKEEPLIATRIDKALSLAECSEFNLTVLDIKLAGSNTFQVADIRRKRGIPFVVVHAGLLW
jgi:hypothetical protein